MSITYSGLKGSGSGTAASNTAGYSITTTAGTDRLLVVCVSHTTQISGVTFDGIAMTRAGENPGSPDTEIWYLVNPPVKTAFVSITFFLTFTTWNSCALQFDGVDQSSPLGNTATSDSAANVSLSMSAGSVGVSTVNDDNQSPVSGNTEVYDSNVTLAYLTANYRIESSSGSYTCGSIGSFGDVLAAEFKAANPPPPANPPIIITFGL